MIKRNDWQKFALEQMPYIIVLALLLLAHFLPGLIAIVAFLGGMTVYVIRKYDGRIPVGLALILLVSAAFILALGNEFFANQLATYCYYFLVMGAILLFIDYLRESKEESKWGLGD